MPFYRVQLKQGRRTIVNRVQAKSVANVKSFFESVSTMKITEILEIKYQASDTSVPVDDFNYYSISKMFIKNSDKNVTFQVVVNNVKKSMNEEKLYNACKKYLTVADAKVDSITTSLFKMDAK